MVWEVQFKARTRRAALQEDTRDAKACDMRMISGSWSNAAIRLDKGMALNVRVGISAIANREGANMFGENSASGNGRTSRCLEL